MKKLPVIFLVFCMAFILAACSEGKALEIAATKYFAEFPGMRMISFEDLFSRIDAGEEPFILSIRENDEYNEGHITGAYNAAWGTKLSEKISMLPKDEPVFVYCNTGQISGQAVALFNMLGIEAYSVKFGFKSGAVEVKGYSAYIETEANELPDAGAKFDGEVLAYVKEYINMADYNMNYTMTASDAAPFIESGNIAVMDIRSADDYDTAHIEGAVNVLFGKDMQESLEEFEGRKIIVVCYSGQAAGQTVAVLRALGYDAAVLESGMNSGWVEEGYPVMRE